MRPKLSRFFVGPWGIPTVLDPHYKAQLMMRSSGLLLFVGCLKEKYKTDPVLRSNCYTSATIPSVKKDTTAHRPGLVPPYGLQRTTSWPGPETFRKDLQARRAGDDCPGRQGKFAGGPCPSKENRKTAQDRSLRTCGPGVHLGVSKQVHFVIQDPALNAGFWKATHGR